MGVFDRLIDQHGGSRTGAREFMESLGPGVGPQHFSSIRFGAELIGADELRNKLRGLSDALSRRIAGQVLRIGGRVLLSAMRQTVPVDSGQLKDSLAVKVKTYMSGTTVAIVGPRIGQGARLKGQATGPHAHLTEFGTAERVTASGKRTGSTPAQHWMERAWDASKEEVGRAMVAALSKSIARALKR